MPSLESRLTGVLALTLLLLPEVLSAQDTVWTAIGDSGVIRAAAVVDSVFLDHRSPQAEIAGGDWAAYMMARLGVHPIPPSLGFLVMVDSQRIVLSGRIRDLPPESRPALGPLLGFVDSETVVRAFIGLHPAGPRAVRFRLETVTLAGFPIPDPFVQNVMSNIGRQYPALTASGRDLFVEIPPGGRIALAQAVVRLAAPPDSTGGGKEKGR